MSRAVRNRRNRREDTSGSHQEMLCGVMVSVRTYNNEVRMVDCKAPVPSTAAFAGRIDDRLLPGGD